MVENQQLTYREICTHLGTSLAICVTPCELKDTCARAIAAKSPDKLFRHPTQSCSKQEPHRFYVSLSELVLDTETRP